MKLIRENLKGCYAKAILGPLFKLIEAVLELFVPLVMANIIDIGIRNGDTGYIINQGMILLLLAVLGAAAAMTCQYYAAVAAGSFGRNLRKQVYHHVMLMSEADTLQFGTGSLITILSNDTNQLQNGVNMTIRLGSRAPFLAVGSVVMALILNWRIGLVFLICTPLIILTLYIIMKRALPQYQEIQEKLDGISRLSGENLEGVRVIRAFSRQEQERSEFDSAGNTLTRILVRVGKISNALNPITTFMINLAIIAIVWLGAEFVFRGTSQPGQIIAMVSYMNQLLLSLIVAANLIVIFTRAIASAKRITQILEVSPSIVDGAGAAEDMCAAAVTFDHVSFSYHKDSAGAAALDDVSFRIARGETVGIIGGTGSGKSTLAKLIARVYDAGEGVVQVNGADVKTYRQSDLRAKIGFVPQTAALLSGTVRENLCLGSRDIQDDALWQALRVAQGAEFVEKMPQGLDSAIEEGSKNLSGGQRQRLTIARALVRQPELLILDDSASALDYATDAALRKALKNQERTTIIISQRAASIQHAQQIIVLDDGRIVGSGTHEQLAQKNDIYREICLSQGLEQV